MLNWKEKGRPHYSDRAFHRALELIDLSLAVLKESTRLTELARVREALVDFFAGENEFGSTADSWRSYFLAFVFAARRTY